MRTYDAVEVIRTKRDGNALPDPMIDWVIAAYTRGDVTDEQMSALAMAIFLNGMDGREIRRWTAAMTNSGIRMDFSGLGKATTDKHSTGGVGDKITLPLAPLVAVFDVAVPQLSGRGLGHTGGTLDKMESIPGWDPNLSDRRMREILAGPVGAVICAASSELTPADRKLYALRDVTATVDTIPLIASSIMSKKIAEGTGALVLDVKVGTGAFMREYEDAKTLAETMVDIGATAGLSISAVLSNMNTPLGLTVGNAIEVEESVEVLAGGGPDDVVDLTVALAEEMLRLAGRDGEDVLAALQDGRAMDRWNEMIRAQGGDPDAPLPTPKFEETVYADKTGYVEKMDAWDVGIGAWRLGAGRTKQGEKVQAAAGIRLHAKPGDPIKAGDPLMSLYTDKEDLIPRSLEALETAVEIGAEKPDLEPLILGRVDPEDA